MGAQEVAAVFSILIATPVAAIYSVARWDASRYVMAPETNSDIEADQAKNKPTRLQECLRFLCFMAFMAVCWAAGWSLQYLPAPMRDAGILFLMCGFPVSHIRDVVFQLLTMDIAHLRCLDRLCPAPTVALSSSVPRMKFFPSKRLMARLVRGEDAVFRFSFKLKLVLLASSVAL